MGILEISVEPYRSMRGTHLFHAPPSNCSQRTRLALEEKAVKWTSHLVILSANQHLTPEYQRLHPGGVVPALVHDGTVVIESNDIIRYIDERFPGPPLVPEDADERETLERLLILSTDLQASLKLLSYTHLYAHRIRKSPGQMAEYARLQQNKELVAWQQRFNDNDFSAGELEEARTKFVAALAILEGSLEDRAFLCGDRYGLADISWTVNVHRARLLDLRKPGLLGLERHEKLMDWLARVRQRPSYDKALTAFEPEWSETDKF
jgi:glutathione S-transferase